MNVENRTIFEGDNLHILRGLDFETIDLIYLDPPFNSNRTYEAPIGSEAAGAAFKDSWTLSDLDNAWHGQLAESEPALYAAISAAEYSHGKSMKAYLIMMGIRMLEMRRVLKPTGSIYLHCDPTASHYLKTMMDSIFGHQNFRNEIVWQRTITTKGNLTRGLARDSDIVLRYSKTDDFVWNSEATTIPYDLDNLDEKTKKQYRHVEPKTKRPYSLTALNAPTEDPDSDRTYELMGIIRTWRWAKDRMMKEIEAGNVVQTKPGNVPRYKRYLDEQKGKALNNIWVDIPNLTGRNNERVGYPTQKPLALLERIILASSNRGDLVLDPFCGCATTCIAAEKHQRQWIGIDLSPKAVELVKLRLDRDLELTEEANLLGDLVVHRTDIPTRLHPEPPPEIQQISLFGIQSDVEVVLSQVELRRYQSYKHTLYGLQEGKCNGCEVLFPFRNLTIDHITPRSKGGTDDPDNLQLLCGACNSTKGDRTQAELIQALRDQGIRRG